MNFEFDDFTNTCHNSKFTNLMKNFYFDSKILTNINQLDLWIYRFCHTQKYVIHKHKIASLS